MICQKQFQPSLHLSLWDSVTPLHKGLPLVSLTYALAKIVKGQIKDVHAMIWILDALFILNYISMALN